MAVYVTGQKARCARCGIHFEVRRTDVPTRIDKLAVEGLPDVLPSPAPASSRVGPPAPVPAPAVVPAPMPVLAPAPEPEPEPVAPSEVLDATFRSPPKAGPIPKTELRAAPRIEVPGYELMELIGKGGMGEVWRAEQKSLGRQVAIKVLPPHLAADPEFVARFDKESTALAALGHPNIIQIIDRGVAGEHYYFVMEFVRGTSLRELIGRGPIAPPDALKILVQICRAIGYAHESHIVHRDLKPENILVDERGHVKVADFGLAGIRGAPGSGQLTATSVAMGTVNYMAPEQRRDARSVDGRADLYSVGVLLYELLTGELPIGRFKLPSEKRPDLDRRIDAIVARCLESEPEARFARASEIAEALEQMISSPSAPRLASTGGTVLRSVPKLAATVLGGGLKGVRTGLAIVGVLSVLGFLSKALPRWLDGAAPEGDAHGHPAPGMLPPNTDADLFVAAIVEEKVGPSSTFSMSFVPGQEKLNAHAGNWRLEGARLLSTQAGSVTTPGKPKLVPRTYVARRYFSAESFAAEVSVSVRPLEHDFPIERDAQRFSELSLRIKDFQLSVYAIPDVGMRMSWRYFTRSGVEVAGNSAQDQVDLIEDETPVPEGPFRLKLQTSRRGKSLLVEGFVNGQRFAHKSLEGLSGQVGKLALGCRNLHCAFEDLVARGQLVPRPEPQPERIE